MSIKIIGEYLGINNPVGVTNPPLCVYRFDSSSSSLLDRTGQGRDLIIVGSGLVYEDDLYSGLIGMRIPTGKLEAPDVEALRVAKESGGGGDASLTIECIAKAVLNAVNEIECIGLGESPETNCLYSLGRISGSTHSTYIEHGAGTDYYYSFPNATAVVDEIVYLTLTVNSDGDEMKMYINGDLKDTISGTAAEKATSGNTQRLNIGNNSNTIIYGVRITNETFSNSDVLDAYESILDDPTEILEKDNKSILEDGIGMVSAGVREKYHGFSYPGIKVGMKHIFKDGNIEDDFKIGEFGSRKNYYDNNIGVGVVVPGKVSNLSRSDNNTYKKPAKMYDFHKIDNAGDRVKYTFPQYTRGACFEQNDLKNRQNITAFEDNERRILGLETNVNRSTSDIHGHAHFLDSVKPNVAFFYDTTNEPWDRPTENNFSGYSKIGYKYTDGSQDPGPIEAPWRTEVSSDYRSPDPSFPDKVLIVVASKELVIFDLDNYDGTSANFVVWMRFMFDDLSNYKALGRGEFSVRSVKMLNGVLVVGVSDNGTDNGGIITIDFKSSDQNVFTLIRSDNHYKADSGITITNRNDTGGVYTSVGVDPSLRITSDNVYSVEAIFDSSDVSKMWTIAMGEDPGPEIIMYIDNEAQILNPVIGDDLGDYDNNEIGYRNIHLDVSGWLWFSRGRKIWRNVFDYQYGRIAQNSINKNIDRMVELPVEIKGLASASNVLFALTTRGIYMLNRGNMEYWLAYSLSQQGGGGKDNNPPSGEILVGSESVFRHAIAFSTLISDFVVVSSWKYESIGGAVSVIRLMDDKNVDSYTYPDLHEDGCFWGLVLPKDD
jgi:hypothetical protein